MVDCYFHNLVENIAIPEVSRGSGTASETRVRQAITVKPSPKPCSSLNMIIVCTLDEILYP